MRATEVAAYARVTYRQVDHWTRETYLVLHAPGSGNERNYPEREARVAWWIARLVEAGFTVPAAARHARHIVFEGVKYGQLFLTEDSAVPRLWMDVSALAPPPTDAYS